VVFQFVKVGERERATLLIAAEKKKKKRIVAVLVGEEL